MEIENLNDSTSEYSRRITEEYDILLFVLTKLIALIPSIGVALTVRPHITAKITKQKIFTCIARIR